jgi:SAM-dependent methyltransferase
MGRDGPENVRQTLGMTSSPTPEEFDAWYSDMTVSPRKDDLVQRHLGLPPYLLSSSLLGWQGILDIAAALRLHQGAVLLDLACGRGGYGLEVAAKTGARLVGVDFSAEAIRQAIALAERLGREARFTVASMTATGLDDASIDGIMCVDAVQFAADTTAACREMRRVLRPGGRAVLTNWIPLVPADPRLPARIGGLDLAVALEAGGFADVEILDRPAWTDAERALWTEAQALDPGDDPGLRSLHEESHQVLPMLDLTRRVLAVATAPR